MVNEKVEEAQAYIDKAKNLREVLLKAIEVETDEEIRKDLTVRVKRELAKVLSPKKEDLKKIKLDEDPAPTEDYFKPEVKLTAMGAPVIKMAGTNTRGFKPPSNKQIKLQLAAASCRPLPEIWSKMKGK